MRHYISYVIAVAIFSLCLLMFVACSSEKTSEPKELLVGTWGGAISVAEDSAFFTPFEKKFGIKIVQVPVPEYPKWFEWAKSTNPKPSVDVSDLETFMVYRLASAGGLEAIDYSLLDSTSLLPNSFFSHGVAVFAYADVIAWNISLLREAAPSSWKDYWNIIKYPGARGFRDIEGSVPPSTIEAALLADDVPPESLYPIEMNRAIRKLSELRKKSEVRLWTSGAQPVDWLVNKSLPLTMAWNGRIFDAQSRGGEKSLGYTFSQALIDFEWFVIPKNPPHGKELAMRFVAFCLEPEQQAKLSKFIPYSPTNEKAEALISPDIAKNLPLSKDNQNKVILRNNQWWAEHEQELVPKWRDWKLSGKTSK